MRKIYFAPDDDTHALFVRDTSVSVMSTQGWAEICTIDLDGVDYAAISPAGKRVICHKAGTIFIFDGETGSKEDTCKNVEPFYSVEFGRFKNLMVPFITNEKYLLFMTDESGVSLYDLPNKTMLNTFDKGVQSGPRFAQLSPDNRLLFLKNYNSDDTFIGDVHEKKLVKLPISTHKRMAFIDNGEALSVMGPDFLMKISLKSGGLAPLWNQLNETQRKLIIDLYTFKQEKARNDQFVLDKEQAEVYEGLPERLRKALGNAISIPMRQKIMKLFKK